MARGLNLALVSRCLSCNSVPVCDNSVCTVVNYVVMVNQGDLDNEYRRSSNSGGSGSSSSKILKYDA